MESSELLSNMNGTDDRYNNVAEGGSFLKGLAMGLACQVAYLLFVFYLPQSELRLAGFLLFALVQFTYLYPLAVFFQKREQGLTTYGVLAVGFLSLLVAAAWFGYAICHNPLSTFSGI